ncbi:hypothetical protein [Microcella humidisoli]|uniref:Uncharacterized protein n=1 Tax=Microcella humidisoli TaxID=2963406 RepID=A0ABY5FYX0_9MICO|nr:hypothetical protein [Microcella humidisoli]UTT63525.1 hypothetical protein NNL39_05345 [Microcella humidisoli]
MTAHALTPQELAALLCAELDPLMTRHGFQAGQAGIGDDVGIVYCMPHAEFRARFPRLAPSIDPDNIGGCTDLNISAGVGPGSRLHNVHLDGVTVAELLAVEGAEFEGDASTIARLPSPQGVVALRTVLERLFARHIVE